MRDNLNGKKPQRKTISIKENLNRRQPQQKTTSMEDDINGNLFFFVGKKHIINMKKCPCAILRSVRGMNNG